MDEEELQNGCLRLVNHLITVCMLPLPKVSSLRDIQNCMFSMMFESIFHLPVPDYMKDPKTPEEEAHNIQAVIDAISLDILTISLSHITGEDVVSKNVYAVYNLLEIFDGIFLHLSDIPASPDISEGDHHIFRDETPQVYQDENSKSDSEFHLKNYDQKRTSFSSRQSKSLDQVFVPSDDLKESQKDWEVVYDRSRKIKRKTSKLGVKANGLKVKRPSFRQTQGVSEEKQTAVSVPERESRSSDVSIVSSHSVVVPENGIIEKSVSTSSKKRSPLLWLKKPRADAASEPQIPPQSSQVTKQTVNAQYAGNLEAKLQVHLEENKELRRIALATEKSYWKTVRTPIRKTVSSVYKRSSVPSSQWRGKSNKGQRRRKCAAAASSQQPIKSEDTRAKTLIQELGEEFPGIQLTQGTMSQMKQRYEKQLRTMHKNVTQAVQRKSLAQLQLEEAAKRQAILSDILRKDIQQQQHKKNVDEHREFQTRVKAAYREARQQSSRIKNYYDKFHNQMKRRLKHRNTREEVLLKHVFEEGLDIQQEQVRELLKYVKERQKNDAADQKLYMDALENFYQTQLSLLTESLASERHDLQIRLNAQKKVIASLKRDYRLHMKKEVLNLQDDITRNQDAFHFRELDAEMYLEKLRDKYSTHFK